MSVRSKVRRAGWIFMAALFLITSLGVGVYGFWQFTRPADDSEQASASCTIGQEPGEVLEVPETFKPEGDVTELNVEDLEEGTGAESKRGDCLVVKYHGTLAASGEKFDGNFDTPLALKFQVGVGQVIPGWDAGMIGMKAGGTRRLILPSDLAYGPSGTQGIPPDSDLVFTVKLISVK